MNESAPTYIEKFITELKPIHKSLVGVEQELLNRTNEPKLSLTTLPTFNRKIWGLKTGLTIIGARTSMGKSALALQFAYDLANQMKETLFLSLEMNVESMIERLFCNVCEVDNYFLLTGTFKNDLEQQEKWGTFKKLVKIPLMLSCGIGKTFEEINQTIDLLNPKPKVIFVDYIQAIKFARNEREEMNEYIRKFREICLKNNIAGVLCSQVGRAVFEDGNKEPCLANLKGSGFLEEHADTVMLLNWQHFYDPKVDKNEYKIIIAKQRNGRIGEYLLHYKPEYYRFYDINKNEEPKTENSVTSR